MIHRILYTAIFLVAVWAAGFVFFLQKLPAADNTPTNRADAVVVYTGGGGRIKAGMNILATSPVQHLLISGVHQDVTRQRMQDLWDGDKDRFACCVDIGRLAESTEGNANELQTWAGVNNYESFVLVTSDYHMPRALLVTRTTMPSADIKPFAVRSEIINDDKMPTNSRALQKLAIEYTKFLAAAVKSVFARL